MYETMSSDQSGSLFFDRLGNPFVCQSQLPEMLTLEKSGEEVDIFGSFLVFKAYSLLFLYHAQFLRTAASMVESNVSI